MSKKQYTIKEMLDALSKPNGKKRLIFDKASIGGLSNRWLIGFFLLIPFIEYAMIFNDYIFSYLGIAQAIVIFIVSLLKVKLFFNPFSLLKKINSLARLSTLKSRLPNSLI